MKRIAVVIIAVFISCLSLYYVGHNKERDYRHRMRPCILFVDAFIAKHGRCPSFSEFHENDDHGMFYLQSGTKYVRMMGGTEANDYVLGYWTGDWHYCYSSWDGKYYNDYGNEMFKSGSLGRVDGAGSADTP